MDGATYHMRVTNKSPTKSSKRTYMVSWLQENHPDLITEADAREGGKTRAQLWEIIAPVKPQPHYAIYDIAAKYGHEVSVTPSYKARSAPVEVIWANIKNPVARMVTKNMSDLKQQVLSTVRSKITEKTWLGAYRTTRQWEDATWARHGCDASAAVADIGTVMPDDMDCDTEDEDLESGAQIQ